MNMGLERLELVMGGGVDDDDVFFYCFASLVIKLICQGVREYVSSYILQSPRQKDLVVRWGWR